MENEQRAAEILAGVRKLAAASSDTVPPEVFLHSARLAARQRRWDDAVADLEEGLADARGSGSPYERALLLEAYGQIDADRAEPGKVSERLLEAPRIFCELGASPDVERVRQAIGAVRPQRRGVRRGRGRDRCRRDGERSRGERGVALAKTGG